MKYFVKEPLKKQGINLKKEAAAVAQKLAAAGIENSEYEAGLIIAHVLNETIGRVAALSVIDAELTLEQHNQIKNIAAQRSDRVPLQHLTGKAAFRSIELEVGPGVFIPRPETETVTQYVIDELQAIPAAETLVFDLCAGSGAISLAIVNEIPGAQVVAVELETNAHAWAKRNIKKIGDGRVTLLQADVTKTIPELEKFAGKVNVIVSNPPYVPAEAIPIDPEVRDHDPKTALYSGVDGLDVIRAISKTMKRFLRPGGLLVLEHAEHQGALVRDILSGDGWSSYATHQDLTRRDRVTTARS